MTTDPITVVRSDGRVVTFTPLGTNAICDLEQQLDRGFGRIMADLGVFGEQAWNLTVTRQVLAQCASLPVEEMGAIIDELGFEAIGRVVSDLIAPARLRELLHG